METVTPPSSKCLTMGSRRCRRLSWGFQIPFTSKPSGFREMVTKAADFEILGNTSPMGETFTGTSPALPPFPPCPPLPPAAPRPPAPLTPMSEGNASASSR